MTKEREALKLALEALESLYNDSELMITYRQFQGMKNSITAIKEALAQPEQNEFNPDWDAMAVMVEEQQRMAKRIAELEAQRKPLSDEEMFKIAEIAWRHGWASCRDAEYIGEEAEDERWGMVGAEVVQDIAAHGIKE